MYEIVELSGIGIDVVSSEISAEEEIQKSVHIINNLRDWYEFVVVDDGDLVDEDFNIFWAVKRESEII